MVTLLIATRNAHKVGEIRAILGEEFHFLTLNDVSNAPEVIEDAGTFAGNATRKAVALAKWLSEAQRFRTPDPHASIGVDPGTDVSPLTPSLSPSEGERVPSRAGEGTSAGSPGCHGSSWLSFTPNVAGLRPGAWGDRLYVLADDSGLEVDALGGAPGVHSARYAALDTGKPGNSPTAENNAKLLRLLGDLSLDRRTARFRCVLALTPVPCSETKGASPVCYAEEAELQTELFEGACEGRIGFASRGRGGFGYDPLFMPGGYEQTFGELSEAVKNQLSHRARALEKLRCWMLGAPPVNGSAL